MNTTDEKILKIQKLLDDGYEVKCYNFDPFPIDVTSKKVTIVFKNKEKENDIIPIHLKNSKECSLAKFKLNQNGINSGDSILI